MKTQAGVYWDKEKQHPINMKAALKWALKNPNVHTSIPGFTTFDQLQLDLSVMEDSKLTPQEIEDLKPKAEGTPLAGLFCQQCSRCIAQCTFHLNIPDMMRSYMYAFGYRNLLLAKDTLTASVKTANPCSNCSDCSIHCTMGFDIKNKIREILPIYDIPEQFIV
jgi:predicted aldo/keto reductase-like oxidoreductase